MRALEQIKEVVVAVTTDGNIDYFDWRFKFDKDSDTTWY